MRTLEAERDDILTMIEMGYEEDDDELIPEIEDMIDQL